MYRKRNKARKRWAGRVSALGDMRGSYRVLVGKPEGKRSCWRQRRRRKDNITKYIQEVVLVRRGLDWSGLG